MPQPIIDLRNKGLLFTVWEDEEEFECVIPEDIKLILEELKENLEFQKRESLRTKLVRLLYQFFTIGVLYKNTI